MADRRDDAQSARQRHTTDHRPYVQRWLPHPLLTLLLVLMWMALLNTPTPGGLLVGIILGMLIPIYTANFWPQRPTIRSPFRALPFLAILMFDIVIANVHVAYLILFRRADRLRTRWICVPLDLTSPEAITVLMATITLTPGTVSSDISADGRTLLVHCLDVGDDQKTISRIKQRYERRIKAFFP